MKKFNTLIIILSLILGLALNSCVKDLESEGVAENLELNYHGTLVDSGTKTPLSGHKITITDGSIVKSSTTSQADGSFSISVDAEDIIDYWRDTSNNYIHVEGGSNYYDLQYDFPSSYGRTNNLGALSLLSKWLTYTGKLVCPDSIMSGITVKIVSNNATKATSTTDSEGKFTLKLNSDDMPGYEYHSDTWYSKPNSKYYIVVDESNSYENYLSIISNFYKNNKLGEIALSPIITLQKINNYNDLHDYYDWMLDATGVWQSNIDYSGYMSFIAKLSGTLSFSYKFDSNEHEFRLRLHWSDNYHTLMNNSHYTPYSIQVTEGDFIYFTSDYTSVHIKDIQISAN